MNFRRSLPEIHVCPRVCPAGYAPRSSCPAEFPHKLLTHAQGDSIFVPASAIGGTHRELRGQPTWPVTVPERPTGIFAVFSQRVKTQLDPRQPPQIVVEITRHTFQGVENCLFGRH